MFTQTIQFERSRESAMFQQFCSRNPEDLLANAQQASTEDMAREYDAKQALIAMYQAKADRVGMTLSGYCKRFNVNLGLKIHHRANLWEAQKAGVL